LDRIHEVLHIHRILTFLIEEQVHVEGVVVIVAIGDCVGVCVCRIMAV
jgi:hypothetical protein